MSLLDQLISSIAPHECLGCGMEGSLLCLACTDRMAIIPGRCYRCRKVSAAALTCPACRKTSKLHRVQVGTIYAGVAKDLVWRLKLAGAQAAARTMAKRLVPLLRQTAPEVIVVPVPTATSRIRQRGYDQARLLARELAKQAKLPYGDHLARHGQAHQHAASRQERLTQLSSAFRVKRPGLVRDAHIILVDDVITTGATLEAAATALRIAGAQRVEAIAFAQP